MHIPTFRIWIVHDLLQNAQNHKYVEKGIDLTGLFLCNMDTELETPRHFTDFEITYFWSVRAQKPRPVQKPPDCTLQTDITLLADPLCRHLYTFQL